MQHIGFGSSTRATQTRNVACASSYSNRRNLLLALPGLALLSNPDAAQAAFSAPYKEGMTLLTGLDADGRIRRCYATNPNCVSTSSVLIDAYAPTWRANVEATPESAADAIEASMKRLYPQAKLEERKTTPPGGVFLRFSVPSNFGDDCVEFLAKPKDKRDGEGEGLIVTYRSIAGSVKYIFPLQTPLSDGGVQKKRVELVRNDLKYRLVGCELVECYSTGN